MTYQIWTRITVASLILFGNVALASEISQSCDAEVVTIGNTVQVSQSESQDGSDTKWHPFLTGINSIENKATLNYKTLAALVDSNEYSSEYNLYNSRAPPVLTK
jgi:hypothetical protein